MNEENTDLIFRLLMCFMNIVTLLLYAIWLNFKIHNKHELKQRLLGVVFSIVLVIGYNVYFL